MVAGVERVGGVEDGDLERQDHGEGPARSACCKQRDETWGGKEGVEKETRFLAFLFFFVIVCGEYKRDGPRWEGENVLTRWDEHVVGAGHHLGVRGRRRRSAIVTHVVLAQRPWTETIGLFRMAPTIEVTERSRASIKSATIYSKQQSITQAKHSTAKTE